MRPVRGWTTVLAAVLLWGCGEGVPLHPTVPRVVVLGFDGMDYGLTSRMIEDGRLPHLARLAGRGLFAPLATSTPPQSPVAWSDFITGHDAGVHGVFDFIHRDPATMKPYLSTTRTVPPGHFLRLGGLQLPLSGGGIELLRRGRAFWEEAEARGVETTVVRIPANFPPSGTATRELSGMGTPDILGSYGTYTFLTSDPRPFAGRVLSGGRIVPVSAIGNVVEAELEGPPNPYRRDGVPVRLVLSVFLDPDRPLAEMEVSGRRCVLAEGEWSDWVPLRFPLLPTRSLAAEARFYLKQVRPVFQLYVSPLNVDPLDPVIPISTPPSFSAELAGATGRFFTQGMPEDTKALEEGVLSPSEFLAQAALAGDEVRRELPWLLAHDRSRLLFYYFGNADQISHMAWRAMDASYPAVSPEEDAPLRDAVPRVYEGFDAVVGEVESRLAPEDTLVVMSDHGFATWRRAVDLNAWLQRQGLLAVKGGATGDFADIDWARTRVYGLGINGLYVNLRGREAGGIVDPQDREAILADVSRRLLALEDPVDGERAVAAVYPRESFEGGPGRAAGPDLVIGYARGYRCSNGSAVGDVGGEVFADNTDRWSGDHCMDAPKVPGVLFTNHPLAAKASSLKELGAAILVELGVGPAGSRLEP